MTSKLKALGGCSSHHLQGAGAYCGGPITGRTACKYLYQNYRLFVRTVIAISCKIYLLME